MLNSTLRVGQRRETFKRLEGGELEFLFLSPEQLANAETYEHLLSKKPSLFVIDEAHCVSEWGHDFRPDYCRLGAAIESLGRPRVLALTATAAPSVREDIVQRLGMRNAKTIVWGFDRPNIWLGVEACPDQETKDRLLLTRVQDAAKPAIVYAATHKHVEDVCRWLREENVNANFYHGGMKKAERDAAQDAFMSGAFDVVVATNAFGMGVDKADVRTVVHYDIAESVDEYYQEVGRAGRDGLPSRALLLYRPEDVGMRRAQAAGGKLTEDQVAEVAEAVAGRTTPVGPKDVAEATDLKPGKVRQALNRLEEIGAVKVLPGGEVLATKKKLDVAGVAEEAVHEQEVYRQYRVGRVELMKDYAETKDCRRRYLLNYFGEATDRPLRPLRQLRGRHRREGGGEERRPAVPAQGPGGAQEVGRRRGDELRRRQGGRAVRRGGLQEPGDAVRDRARVAADGVTNEGPSSSQRGTAWNGFHGGNMTQSAPRGRSVDGGSREYDPASQIGPPPKS